MEDELFVVLAGCSLAKTTAKDNWVEKSGAGELPNYICKVARAIKRSGHSTSQAIAIAVSRIKVWAGGGGDVNADTRAKAAKALAEWEALKASASLSSSSGVGMDNVKLADFHEDGDTEILSLCMYDYSVDEVRRSFEMQNNTSGGLIDSFVTEMWSRHLIVARHTSEGTDDWLVPYHVTEDGQIEFGDPVEVKKVYVPKDGSVKEPEDRELEAAVENGLED